MTMKAPSVVLLRRSVKNKGRRPVTYWALRWPGSDGKARRQNIGRVDQMTEKQAGEVRRQKMIDLGIGKAVRDPVRMSVSEFLDADRVAITSRMSRGTIIEHRTASNHAIAVIGGDVRLDRVGWQHVSALESWLSDVHQVNGRTLPPCSRATIRKTIVTLKAAWNRAIKRGIIVSNPFAGEKLAKVQSKQKRIFTVEEIDAMCDAGRVWWTAFIRLGFTTGLRLGEMLSLTWADVDEDGMQVIVSAKRAGPSRLEWSAKSHTERRVPLCADTATALLPLKLRGGGSPYVFIDRQRLDVLLNWQKNRKFVRSSQWLNNLPRDFGVLQNAAHRLLVKRRKNDESEWVRGTVHDLRRSYGTHMAKLVSMNDLRRLMGHSSITTTADFYLGVSDDLAAKVNAAFSRSA